MKIEIERVDPGRSLAEGVEQMKTRVSIWIDSVAGCSHFPFGHGNQVFRRHASIPGISFQHLFVSPPQHKLQVKSNANTIEAHGRWG